MTFAGVQLGPPQIVVVAVWFENIVVAEAVGQDVVICIGEVMHAEEHAEDVDTEGQRVQVP